MMFASISRTALLLMVLLVTPLVYAQPGSQALPQQITVSTSIHEPFFFHDKKSGLTVDLLNAMNQVQTRYKFVATDIPSRRVFQSINKKWADIVIWDNLHWGWQNYAGMSASIPLLNEGDKFIALRKTNNTQSFFNQLATKKLTLINGYHYKFLEYEKEADALKSRYHINFVQSEDAALKMILAKRAEIGVVSESTLAWFLKRNPEFDDALLISEHYDAEYSRHFLIPPSAPISVEQVNEILLTIHQSGMLAALFSKYGLTPPNY